MILQKFIYFSKKKTKFGRFEKSYYLKCTLRQNCFKLVIKTFSWSKSVGFPIGRTTCARRSLLGLNARKSPSSNFSNLRVSFFSVLINVQFYSPKSRHEWSVSVIPVKSFWSGFWTTLLGPRPDDSVVDFTAISTRGCTNLSIAVKIASSVQFSTFITALSAAFLILLSLLFSKTCVWRVLFSPTVTVPKSLEWLLGWKFRVWFSIEPPLVLSPMTKSFKVSFNWLSYFLC